MAGTRIVGIRIIALSKIIRNKYENLTQTLIFHPMLRFILKSSHKLPLILCQFTEVLSIRSWLVNSKSRPWHYPHLIWALSSNTAFLIGLKALNGGKTNKSMMINNFFRTLKKRLFRRTLVNLFLKPIRHPVGKHK